MAYQPVITDADIARVKYSMREHVGEGNRITYEVLTRKVYGKYSDTLRRNVRLIVHHINADLNDSMFILTDTSAGGVWLPDNDPGPAVRHYRSERSRAMETLDKVNALGHKIERRYGREALNPQPAQGQLFG